MIRHLLFFLLLAAGIGGSECSGQWLLSHTDDPNTRVAYIAFYNRDTGYAYPQNITIDGGITWHKDTALSKFGKYGIARLYHHKLMLIGESYYLVSDNNGRTWDTMHFPVDPGYRGSTFYNDTVGYILGYKSIIFMTQDGGLHWRILTTAVPESDLVIFDPKTFISFSSNYGTVVFKDSGRAKPDTFPYNLADLTAFCVSPSHLVFTSHYQDIPGKPGPFLISVSRDTAHTWQTVDTVDNYISNIFFTTPDTAYAIGLGGIIYQSIDSGWHWQKQYSPTTADLSSYFVLDSRNIYIGGSTGEVLYTHTGGFSFVSHGLRQTKLKPSFYPNPCSSEGVLKLETDMPLTLRMNLYSLTGVAMQSEIWHTTAGENTINIKRLQRLIPGIYYITLTAENSAPATLKIVILR